MWAVGLRNSNTVTPSPTQTEATATAETTIPEETTTPAETATTEPTTTTEQPTDQPTSNLPMMPTKVGDLTSLGDPAPDFALYTNSDASVTVLAMHIPDTTVKDLALVYPGAKTIGQWTCFNAAGETDYSCAVDSHGGALMIATMPDADALAAWGDLFLAAWK